MITIQLTYTALLVLGFGLLMSFYTLAIGKVRFVTSPEGNYRGYRFELTAATRPLEAVFVQDCPKARKVEAIT